MADALARLQPILISRFLLNLRYVDSPQDDTGMARFSKFTAPNLHVPTIKSIVGNMGEPLEHEDDQGYVMDNDPEVTPVTMRGELQQHNDFDILEVRAFRSIYHILTISEAPSRFLGRSVDIEDMMMHAVIVIPI